MSQLCVILSYLGGVLWYIVVSLFYICGIFVIPRWYFFAIGLKLYLLEELRS